jgi:hypothetical protein
VDLDSCVNCDAGLIAASTICPQCGWPKDKPIESVNDVEIESDTESPEVKFESRLPRPAGVRLLGMLFIVNGILLAAGAIIFASFILFVTISGAMGILGGIGDPNMVIPLPIGGVDPTMMSSLNDVINEIPYMDVLVGSTMMMATSASMMSFEAMLVILTGVGMFAAAVVAIGLVYFMFGRYLLKGNKWARYLVIVSAVISIPAFIPFVDELDLSILVSALISGLILYYLFRPHVRAYFSQPRIKKAKSKNPEIN